MYIWWRKRNFPKATSLLKTDVLDFIKYFYKIIKKIIDNKYKLYLTLKIEKIRTIVKKYK